MYQEIFRKKSIFNGLKIIKKGGKVFRIDGKRYLVTASVIPTLDWLMIGLTPVNELTKAGKAMTQIIYVVGIIAALISTFFSLRVSHSCNKAFDIFDRYHEKIWKRRSFCTCSCIV